MARSAGRSKGCKTCRRRKKGCDLRRPSCNECLKTGYTCEGYHREARFINYGTGGTPSQDVAIKPKAKVSVPIFSGSLQRSAYIGRFYELFWESYLPYSGSNATTPPDSHLHPYTYWVKLVPRLNGLKTMLHAAFSAMVLARLGRTHNDLRLTHTSFRLHSAALTQLRTTLHNEKKIISDETFASVMLLGLYEIFEGSDKTGFGWTSHMQGASHLFGLRGPNFHSADACRSLFLAFRLNGIIHAIGSRKSTYLAGPEWTTTPWEGHQKTQEDKLLDIMVFIPSLMEEADLVRSQSLPSSILSATISLAGRCRALIYELEQWHGQWSKGLVQPSHKVQRSEIYQGLDRKHPGKYFPIAFHFVDLETAHLENLYWASLLLVHANFCMTYEWARRFLPLSTDLAGIDVDKNPYADESPASFKPPTLAPPKEIHAYAFNIAQSLEYFLQPKLGAAGSSLIAFPLAVVRGYFEYFRLPEASWFTVIFDRFQRLGIPLEQFLDGMANEDVATLVRDVDTD